MRASTTTRHITRHLPLLLLSGLLASPSFGAVSLDRTRVIYPGDAKSISLTIRNNNKTLPYLAQAWLEDASGNKINSPFTVLPPVQRLEPDMESLVKVQSLPALALLPQDKESLFYFSVREVPPRSDQPNTLQLAMQTRIKFLYRPSRLVVDPASPAGRWPEQVTLTQTGDKYRLTNPTPYFVTLVSAARDAKGEEVDAFTPLMLAPGASETLGVGPAQLGKQPSFTYVDDYGGRRALTYRCNTRCTLQPQGRGQ